MLLQNTLYSFATKVTVGLLLLPLIFSTYGMNMNPSLDVLGHAHSVNLHFNQRMLYAHATAPSNEITEAILSQTSPSNSKLAVQSCKRALNEDRRILQALLYISQGYLDAAHDIVQCISEQDAVYIHALLHRLEGQYVGEGGMKGWSNSDYWNDQVGSVHPHFPRLCQFVTSPTCEEFMNISPSERTSKFVQSIQKQQQSSTSSSSWNMSLFLGLCIDSHRHHDLSCIRFCELVTTYEYRLLLEDYCTKLGL